MAEQNLILSTQPPSLASPPKILTKEDIYKDVQIQVSPLVFLTPNQALTEKYLTIPAIQAPNMSDEDYELQMDWLCKRTLYTRMFVAGLIDPDDFLDALSDTGIFVYDVIDLWEKGISLSQGFKEM